MMIQTTFVNGISPWPPYVSRKTPRVRATRTKKTVQHSDKRNGDREAILSILSKQATYQDDIAEQLGMNKRRVTEICHLCADIISEVVHPKGKRSAIYWIAAKPPKANQRNKMTQIYKVVKANPWTSAADIAKLLEWTAKETRGICLDQIKAGGFVSRQVQINQLGRGFHPINLYKVAA